jgi:hypothetical protein
VKRSRAALALYRATTDDDRRERWQALVDEAEDHLMDSDCGDEAWNRHEAGRGAADDLYPDVALAWSRYEAAISRHPYFLTFPTTH